MVISIGVASMALPAETPPAARAAWYLLAALFGPIACFVLGVVLLALLEWVGIL